METSLDKAYYCTYVPTGVALRADESSQDGDNMPMSKSTLIEGDREKGDGGVTGDNADPWLLLLAASEMLSGLP